MRPRRFTLAVSYTHLDVYKRQLLPSFPLILGNALYWCAENSEALTDMRTLHTGEMLHTDSLVQWHAWNGESFIEVLSLIHI